jgi:hypothetical protein
VDENVCVGTWENQSVPMEAAERAENAMKLYVTLVVGPTHSRGVNRVMSVEGNEAHSKGLAV